MRSLRQPICRHSSGQFALVPLNHRRTIARLSRQHVKVCTVRLNLPLFDVPLSQRIMRLS